MASPEMQQGADGGDNGGDVPTTKATISMLERLALRSAILLMISSLGFIFMEALVYMGQEQILSIQMRFPEIMLVVRALTLITWVEVCLLWIRVLLQPSVDVQRAALIAETSPIGAAIVYTVHQATWLVRVVVFLSLCEFLK